MTKIYFWEKLANQPEKESEDTLLFNEVEEDKSIRELIRSLEDKIIGKKRNLKDLNPENPSIKKWLNTVFSNYPEKKESEVEDIINEYRAVLNSRSREKEKFILAVLQLNDVIAIVHCKKGPSLAELEDKVISVQTILHSKNIVRADIIKKEDGILKLLAYEQSRKFSKGHAKFWGIDIEDIGWESLGNICLNIELDAISIPIQINLDNDQLKNMIDEQKISPSGKINLGKEEGTISKVFVYGKALDYPKFYDFFVTETEKLDEYKKRFDQIIPTNEGLGKFMKDDKYRYMEDENSLIEIKGNGEETLLKKTHPRYNILFLTKYSPVIKPKQSLLTKINDAIFNNTRYEIYHAGDDASKESFRIGNLIVYNNLTLCDKFEELTNNLINKIQDAQSSKLKLSLKVAFCHLMKNCIKSKHFTYIFDYLLDSYIPEIEYEFQKTDGLSTNEDVLEFKSASAYNPKPTEFAKNTLVPTIKKYIDVDKLTRQCIIYGIEDDQSINPIYNFKSDMAVTIETTANKELESEKVIVNIHPIKYKEGNLLFIFLTRTE
ncbi:MAG: hypothetical protein H6502_04635 [Candidatus Woesearchaeota archaeon]|nr:MAG: hypothetical protein H6502_04635 [Candidatus Woesearchaeota archaeon]